MKDVDKTMSHVHRKDKIMRRESLSRNLWDNWKK